MCCIEHDNFCLLIRVCTVCTGLASQTFHLPVAVALQLNTTRYRIPAVQQYPCRAGSYVVICMSVLLFLRYLLSNKTTIALDGLPICHRIWPTSHRCC